MPLYVSFERVCVSLVHSFPCPSLSPAVNHSKRTSRRHIQRVGIICATLNGYRASSAYTVVSEPESWLTVKVLSNCQ